MIERSKEMSGESFRVMTVFGRSTVTVVLKASRLPIRSTFTLQRKR